MGLNDTPSGERLHIGFFGMRNAGKSSLINAVTAQEIAVVSDVKGTTTDPVYKAMELLPMGPVMLIDTPGFDDEGELGLMRVKRAKQVLNKTDVAVLVSNAKNGLSLGDKELIELFKTKGINYIIVYNKADEVPIHPSANDNEIYVSALTKEGITELKEKIAGLAPKDTAPPLIADLIKAGDTVVLVTPIDKAAPKGRLILPQQQAIRDILDSDAVSVVVKEDRLEAALSSLTVKPAMVVTDSQVFGPVSKVTPPDIPLTSFSILMARRKGFLEAAVKGAAYIKKLKAGDTVLISEGCTHHRQCNDIGTVKIPMWLKNHIGADINIETSSGASFPEDLTKYKLVIHCGGCMLNDREVKYRMKCALDQGVPFCNYGIAIAEMHGILKRSIEIFPDLVKELEK